MDRPNPQSRSWQLTIPHPDLMGLTHEVLREKLQVLNAGYYCMVDEIGEGGLYHTHVYIYRNSPIRQSRIERLFPNVHHEKCDGTALENRDYLLKTGKWADTKKADTTVEGTFEEAGDIPLPSDEKSPQKAAILKALIDGRTPLEIVRDDPSLIFQFQKIEHLSDALFTEKHGYDMRDIKVSYLFSASGAGKTFSVFQKHPANEICRITTYNNGSKKILFDSYHGQPVLVFEEFRSQIPISEMLNYLDIYPLQLPARYYDRTAAYTQVYITSNLPLEQQYQIIQSESPETWRSFCRRITEVIEFLPDRTQIKHK